MNPEIEELLCLLGAGQGHTAALSLDLADYSDFQQARDKFYQYHWDPNISLSITKFLICIV